MCGAMVRSGRSHCESRSTGVKQSSHDKPNQSYRTPNLSRRRTKSSSMRCYLAKRLSFDYTNQCRTALLKAVSNVYTVDLGP